MTKEELEKRINEIEWDDSEMKTAQNKLPNDVWETVSTFSNTSGGWIVFGVHQHGKNVDFKSDLVCSTVTYWFSEQVQILVNAIRENVYSMFDIQRRLNISSRRYVLVEMLTPAIEQGYVLRAYPDKPRHPKQRYYLSEKGLKLVK
jgi:predicted HTH transcriptional regulator